MDEFITGGLILGLVLVGIILRVVVAGGLATRRREREDWKRYLTEEEIRRETRQ